jgi:UDP-GlcNAc:undecaprenyl-phosphate GlcNAc-1-phosphate transferase
MVLVTVWLTAIANAVNFMDGSDGLIGSLSVAMALAGIWLVTPGAGALLLVVAASALGFLVWNHAPASIFMGDVGSQFLGLLIGGTLLLQLEHRVAVVPVVLLMSPLLFDTGYTLLWRARAGRNLFAAHREHLYQRLISSGVSHRAVAAGYALAVGVAGVIAHGWDRLPAAGQAATIVAGAVLGAAYVLWVRSVERASMGGRGGAGRGA